MESAGNQQNCILPPSVSPAKAVSLKKPNIWEQVSKLLTAKDTDSHAKLKILLVQNKVPLFHEKLPTAGDKLQHLVRREAKEMLIKTRSKELMDNSELMEFYELLEKNASEPYSDEENFLSYVDYKKLRPKFPVNVREIMTACTFLKLLGSSSDPYFRVSVNNIFSYVMRKIWVKTIRIELARFDELSKGYLNEMELDLFIREVIPKSSELALMNPAFLPFYLCIAARKFFFFLDSKRIGRVKIVDMIGSGFIEELLELREDILIGENWFNLEVAIGIYTEFVQLDRDENGMLTAEELVNYRKEEVCLTRAFISRIFEEVHTYDNEMDFRGFVEFCLVMRHPKERPSLEFLFRVLDVRQKGYLDGFCINFFFKDMAELMPDLIELGQMSAPIHMEDIKDIIFDMVKPADPYKITLKDFLNCGSAHIVVKILTDFGGLLAYDGQM